MSDVLLATSFTICAPMFSSASFSSISFATVTPSLVIVGEPNFLSRITLRPFGPRVTLTALARLLTPRRIPCREESPYTICFAMTDLLRLAGQLSAPSRLVTACGRPAINDGQHFVFGQDEVLLAIELDFSVFQMGRPAMSRIAQTGSVSSDELSQPAIPSAFL